MAGCSKDLPNTSTRWLKQTRRHEHHDSPLAAILVQLTLQSASQTSYGLRVSCAPFASKTTHGFVVSKGTPGTPNRRLPNCFPFQAASKKVPSIKNKPIESVSEQAESVKCSHDKAAKPHHGAPKAPLSFSRQRRACILDSVDVIWASG